MDTVNETQIANPENGGQNTLNEMVAFMEAHAAGQAVPAEAPAEEPVAEAAPEEASAEGESAAVDAAAEPEPEAAAEPAPEIPEIPKRGGPSPLLRQFMQQQQARIAQLETERAEFMRQQTELMQAIAKGKMPVAEPELPGEPEEDIDPLERDVKDLRAKLEQLTKAQQEREAQAAAQAHAAAVERARSEIVSEVDAVVKEFPQLDGWRNEIYANISMDMEHAQQAKVRPRPVDAIARDFARRLGLAKPASAAPATAPAGKPSAVVAKPPAPKPAAVPRHPSAAASLPIQPVDMKKASWADLASAWAGQAKN